MDPHAVGVQGAFALEGAKMLEACPVEDVEVVGLLSLVGDKPVALALLSLWLAGGLQVWLSDCLVRIWLLGFFTVLF